MYGAFAALQLRQSSLSDGVPAGSLTIEMSLAIYCVYGFVDLWTVSAMVNCGLPDPGWEAWLQVWHARGGDGIFVSLQR